MTPHEAAGRALHTIEHPYADPSVWEALDDYTRTWWINRAQPITQAVQEAAA